jgi:transposase
LEAGLLSQWLFNALAEAGLPVICVETRHMRAVPKAQVNKTDRNDARDIAQMMGAGLYRPVHVKTWVAETARATWPRRARHIRAPSPMPRQKVDAFSDGLGFRAGGYQHLQSRH